MKKLSIKHGLIFVLTAFSLVGCSQNHASSSSIHEDILKAGSEYIKVEYSNASSGNMEDTDELNGRYADAVSDTYCY